jgi:hypothetical protein
MTGMPSALRNGLRTDLKAKLHRRLRWRDGLQTIRDFLRDTFDDLTDI